eukprot:54301-Pyramimonas_sp.AAC.1
MRSWAERPEARGYGDRAGRQDNGRARAGEARGEQGEERQRRGRRRSREGEERDASRERRGGRWRGGGTMRMTG